MVTVMVESELISRPPPTPALLDDIVRWGRAFGSDVRGKVGYLPGGVRHLWHGDYADRLYGQRARWLAQYDFNPLTDIAEDEVGCWTWTTSKPELHRRLEAHFGRRPRSEFVASG